LTGGSNADRFNVTDTGITATTADRITDFVSGVDTIVTGAGDAGSASNYTEATAAAADLAAILTAARTAFSTGAADAYYFGWTVIDGVTTGYLVVDSDADADEEGVVILSGISGAGIAYTDITG
jgi:glycine/D-amino acid oxidase-like deaminating enzyme